MLPSSTSFPVSHSPLAERLSRISTTKHTANFHAVPLAGAYRSMDREWRERFDCLINNTASIDVSYTAPAVDSFFMPTGPLAQAQEQVATALGVQSALFTSCGTTLSNWIALDAMKSNGKRLLLDGTSHQSINFAAKALGMEVTVIEPLEYNGYKIPNLDLLEETLENAANKKNPFDNIVITASSYEGYIVNTSELIERIVTASPKTSILIDAAWIALHFFSKKTVELTPIFAIKQLQEKKIKLPNVVITTSIHKTLCSLRQGSVIFTVNGTNTFHAALQSSLFTYHTTSPSWPILASIDLACMHASSLGNELINRAKGFRDYFLKEVKNDPDLRVLVPNSGDISWPKSLVQDPLKLTISTTAIAHPREVRSSLYLEYGIYVSRCTTDGVILNFTIRVQKTDVDSLIIALRSMLKQQKRTNIVTKAPRVGSSVNEYIIPYPPGVPIARPGDTWTFDRASFLQREVAAGAQVFRLPS